MKYYKNTVNVIVPFGFSDNQPEREDNLKFLTENCLCQQNLRNIRLILIECSHTPTQGGFAQIAFDEYHFLRLGEGELFSPGTVQNKGFVLSSPASHVYIHQADFLLPPKSIKKAIHIMHRTRAPFVFPYYSKVNLSKPVSVGIISGNVDWIGLYRAIQKINSFMKRNFQYAFNVRSERVYLSEKQIMAIEKVLPDELHSTSLSGLSREEIWGLDDGSFTYFQDYYDVKRFCDILVNFRPGPRVCGSYLATSEAYNKIGGAPEYQGWGYEDLSLWVKVQAFFPYGIDGNNVVYRNLPLTTTQPLLHLWHSTSSQPEYYSHSQQNEQEYTRLRNLSSEEIAASTLPLVSSNELQLHN